MVSTYVGDDYTIPPTTSNDQANNDLMLFEDLEDLEMEFAVITNKIKQVLNSSHIDIKSLLEQLQTMSAVKDKKVPLFDDDVFENVTTVDKVWE